MSAPSSVEPVTLCPKLLNNLVSVHAVTLPSDFFKRSPFVVANYNGHTPMPTTVFFSWQSDRPGRNFIDKALREAIDRISQDLKIDEAVREGISLDRDTQDVPGSPSIFDTILKKIDRAAVFVADLTFVGTSLDGDLLPNPNVLLEYGYALKSLGDARIVAVMNDVHGDPSSLPFDLKTKRFPVTYTLADDADPQTRSKVREALSRDLEKALRVILGSQEFLASQPKPPTPPPREDRKPRLGEARFRSNDEPLGTYQDPVALLIGSTERQRIYLADGPAMWLRVATEYAPERNANVTEIAGQLQSLAVLPLFDLRTTTGQVLASDGSAYFKTIDEKKTPQTVFAFTDAEVWAIDTWTLRQFPNLVYLDETRFTRSLQMAAEFLDRLGFKGPYRWIAGMEGVNNRFLSSPNGPKRGLCMSDTLKKRGYFQSV